jgi:NADPH-dependent curcumin reductase CurA
MRGWMNDVRSYVPPVGLGEVMRAQGGGEVVASQHPDFAVGDHVTGVFGAQEYAESDGAGVQRSICPRRPCRPTWRRWG